MKAALTTAKIDTRTTVDIVHHLTTSRAEGKSGYLQPKYKFGTYSMLGSLGLSLNPDAKKFKIQGIEWLLKELHMIHPEGSIQGLWMMRSDDDTSYGTQKKIDELFIGDKLSPYYYAKYRDEPEFGVKRGIAGPVEEAELRIDAQQDQPYLTIGFDDFAIAKAIDARLAPNPPLSDPSSPAPVS